MTGANYTGGKRNVARTRFRDSARRVQKNHFGRRRLGILSRGLVNGTHPTVGETTTSGISGILLEHAQREISCSSRSAPVQQTGAHRTSIHDPSSSAGSPSSGINVACSHLGLARTPDCGSCESLPHLSSGWPGRPSEDSSRQAEVDRILEFSRTVGLCNYSTSPKQDVLGSPLSRLDSESRWLDPLQQRNKSPSSSKSGLSGRQDPMTRISHAVQDSEILQMSQTGTSRSNSLRETASRSEQAYESETDLVYAEPTSDYEYPEHCNSESPPRSTCISDPLLGEDKGSPRILESNPYEVDPPSPPFYALEHSTSPLPPSSPSPSSTTYGSLLPLRQVAHGAEAATALLDSDEILLPSTMSGSCEADSSSRSVSTGNSRHVTPDLASASPLRHLPHSGLVPATLASSSKADLIPDLLACDDPWNVIGNMLDLPPIPAADATYFKSIWSHHTGQPHEHVSSSPSSSVGQVGIRESCSARDEGPRWRAVHSDGDLLNRRDPWPFRSIHETRSTCGVESQSPSSSTRGSSPILREAPQTLLEPHAPPTSPGPLLVTSKMDSESHSALAKTYSPSPCTLTPQRSTSPSPESDPVGLMPTPTRITPSNAQPPKLECPDLFQDEDDSFVF